MARSCSIEKVFTLRVFWSNCTLRRRYTNQDFQRFGFQWLGSGYTPTPILTTRRSAWDRFSAITASAMAYRVGLLAQYPPSMSVISSPLSVLTVVLSKNG